MSIDVIGEAIGAARKLSPLIQRLRRETEADRRIAQPIVDGLRDAGLWRMVVAKELRGLELPTPAALEVYEALAVAEASVAWVVWNNALPCFLGRFLAPAARAEVFADPAWLYAISTRPTGQAVVEDGGYRVEGRWSLVSGCELAEWIGVLCAVVEDGTPRTTPTGAPETRFAFVRRGDVEILDTWHVSALRGTGSHDVVVAGRHVPHERTASVAEPSTLEGPIGRVPIICTMAAGYASQTLGMARAAVDTIVELATTKASPDLRGGLRDRPGVQAAIAGTTAALDAARSHLRACTARLWDEAVEGRSSVESIGSLWGAAHHAVDVSRRALDTMYEAGGTSSLYDDCPLERSHRDLYAMLRHLVAQSLWLEDAGRVRLGLAPQHPLYAV